MAAHGVMDVYLPPLCFSFKQLQRFSRSRLFGIESLLVRCLWCFHPFAWAIDYRFSLPAGLGMELYITLLYESLSAISTFIGFRQLGNVFYDEGVPFVDTDC